MDRNVEGLKLASQTRISARLTRQLSREEHPPQTPAALGHRERSSRHKQGPAPEGVDTGTLWQHVHGPSDDSGR
jgi:hypothetical protein